MIFFVPYYVIKEHDQLALAGENFDIWSVSIISFTCMYAVVTIKLWLWTRYFSFMNFLFYTVFSILVYIVYVWFSNYWEMSQVRYTIIETHKAPLFYLCILLIGGTVYEIESALNFFTYVFKPNGSDIARSLVHEKKGAGFNDLTQEIKITEEEYRQFDEKMKPIF